jgi:hypothetical protein
MRFYHNDDSAASNQQIKNRFRINNSSDCNFILYFPYWENMKLVPNRNLPTVSDLTTVKPKAIPPENYKNETTTV